jgi:predicted dehydrogenase
MSENLLPVNRREFVKQVAAVGGGVAAAASTLRAQAPAAQGRVIGANDRINVAVIGGGMRGPQDARTLAGIAESSNVRIAAVCDLYEKRKKALADRYKCDGYLDYREVLGKSDIDAVVVAVPDHWHGKMAMEAMQQGKDVYLEKPMTHTIAEARQIAEAVKTNNRVLQVGSQTTSGEQWRAAKQYIADGAVGRMVMSQGSYHRNSKDGEWNYTIDPDAGPEGKGDNYLDWKTWLGGTQARPFDADRFFRFRKYWDYSGGIATDLYFHVVAPMNLCWPQPEFPYRVLAGGGIYGGSSFEFKREVPDTFNVMADFASGHSLVLTSSLANSRHIPGLIRGHLGSIVMVDNGQFESRTDHITLYPERSVIDAEYTAKFGDQPKTIPVDVKDTDAVHMANFLDCMRTRKQPTLSAEVGYRVQVTISMAVQSFREGRVLYWDAKNQTTVTTPPAFA